MADFFPELNEKLIDFIGEQKLFFTATAPNKGRVNLSPKGMDTFRCLDNKKVGYLDLTGSSNETAAHVQENGRLTFMFCSFGKKPLILRLWGHGEVVHRDENRWEELFPPFSPMSGQRQIVLLNIEGVETSCGWGVPHYQFDKERTALVQWAEGKSEEEILAYWKENNQESYDGLPTNLIGEKDKGRK